LRLHGRGKEPLLFSACRNCLDAGLAEMRFLILTQYFPPEIGAAPTRLAACARELVRLGHDVEVLTALPNYPTGRIFPKYRGRFYVCEQWEGVQIYRVWAYAALGSGLKRAMNYASLAFTSLFGLLKVKRPDYIFVESPPPFLVFPAFLASRLWVAPIILNVSDLWPDSVRELGVLRKGMILRVAGALEIWAYQKADFISAVTQGIWTSLVQEKAVPVHKLLLLPNGADTEQFKPIACDIALKRSLGLQDKQIVLYQGTLGHAHALENALRAARLLSENGSIHLLFLGNGSERTNLIALARALSLKNVTFIDFVPVEQVPRYLSLACCGLVSLRDLKLFRDARPAKLLPIMASAKPVVFCGPAGEVARMLREARAGIIAPPDDPAALASAIQTIADNSILATQLGNNGRHYVEQQFTWSKLVVKWLNKLTQAHADSHVMRTRD
jgi:colanic acid biosynthesis glycosyl transferase WcaI